jgi:hypothetical protein
MGVNPTNETTNIGKCSIGYNLTNFLLKSFQSRAGLPGDAAEKIPHAVADIDRKNSR